MTATAMSNARAAEVLRTLRYSRSVSEVEAAALDKAINMMAPPKQSHLTMDIITEAVSEVTGVPVNVLRLKQRRRRPAYARWMVFYLAHYYLGTSFPVMAEYFNYSQHVTAFHGVRMAEWWIEKPYLNPDWVKELGKVKQKLGLEQ